MRRKGFFELEDVELTPTKPKRKATKRTSTKAKKPDLPPCEECGMYKTNKHPMMGITGEGRTGILFLSEAQGATEDERGYQLCGSAGQLLRNDVLAPLGYDLDVDFCKLNAVRCRPIGERGSNRSPTDREVALCHAGTWKRIREFKPKAIIIAGRVPLQSYMMTLDISGERPAISQWADWAIPDRTLGCWVIPQYHPSFFQYGMNSKLIEIYKLKMGVAIEKALRPFPDLTNEADKVECLYQQGDIISLLDNLVENKPPLLTLDWETTGLKPFAPDHEIVTCALAWNPEHGVSFPVTPEVVPALLRVIKEKSIGKTAHNFKFEELWARIILGTEIANWRWCSQLASHVLDDRHGITSLEFQAFVRYGVVGFKDETSPYMKTETANGVNRVKECPIDKLLLRNALDAMLAHRLALDQMAEMQLESKLPKAYEFFHEGSLALLDCEITGFRASSEVFQEAFTTISEESKAAKARVMDSHYARLWEKKTGVPLNPGSAPQLKTLLFDYVGIEPRKKSAKGNPTLDKEDIEEFSRTLPQQSLRSFLIDVTRLRSATKTESTYIKGIIREIYKETLHPFFHLHRVRTYRGSSSRPNLQNIPARDERMTQLVRSGMFPHHGQQLLEIDFGMHEVRIAATFTQDPELIRYCKDPTSDMHRDQTERVYLLPRDQITKAVRNLVKGAFVFAQLYGSWYRPCAEKLWKDGEQLLLADGSSLREHLMNQKLTSLDVFTEHIQAEENRFWKQFSTYAKWKEKWVARYYKTGRVPLKYGFRRQGYLARNEILNTPIQGTAFHILLWSLIELSKFLKKDRLSSVILGQIHDCILLSVQPEELHRVVTMANWIMSERALQVHSWCNVPLEVEFELCDIDAPWSTKKKVPYTEFLDGKYAPNGL